MARKASYNWLHWLLKQSKNYYFFQKVRVFDVLQPSFPKILGSLWTFLSSISTCDEKLSSLLWRPFDVIALKIAHGFTQRKMIRSMMASFIMFPALEKQQTATFSISAFQLLRGVQMKFWQRIAWALQETCWRRVTAHHHWATNSLFYLSDREAPDSIVGQSYSEMWKRLFSTL